MRLKRLELKGFKSFANDTVLHFSENVTGIVGPNGSGKSNIVDAMRWVLGEQSSKDLRLEAMSDVIFNGTKKRRKSPYAKVSVVFENDKGVLPSEYTEVEVQRTLDQDGNSEYYINGVRSRLKDIKSLFVDTGIGSNFYAIIELKMVDDILNDTDNARRKMFEQAAGISKYKQRKHQSLLKLKGTNADLERVDDLLHEINLNLKALQRQARKAKRYLHITRDYEDLSIKLAVVKSRHINEKYKEYRQAIDVQKMEIVQAQARIDALELEIEECKNKNLEKEGNVSTARRSLSEIVNAIRTIENDKNITEQRVAFAERQLKELREREERIHERIALVQDKIKEKEERISEEAKILEELHIKERSLSEEKEHLENRMATVGADRSQRLDRQQNAEREQVHYEKEMSINDTRLAGIEQRGQENEKKLKDWATTMETLKVNYKTEIHLIDELEKKLAALGQSENERQDNLQRIDEKIEAIKEELSENNRKLDAQQNEYKLIKNLVDKLEGFPESIKFLNKDRTWSSNARLFSDILYCEEQYRTAIENFLEPYLSYYVVPNYSAAYSAIALLKGAQKGKAQFFINSTFEEPKRGTDDFPGLIKAIDIVEVDAQFRRLMEGLLNKVYILENSEEIDEFTERYPSLIILTQDGTIIKDTHRIRGGSSGLFEGKRIGRRKNLEKLHASIRHLQILQSRQEQSLNKLMGEKQNLLSEDRNQEMKSLKASLENAYRQSQQSAIKIESIKEQIEEVKLLEQQAANEKKILQDEKTHLKEALQKVTAQLQNMKTDLTDIEGKYARVNQEAADLSEKYNTQKIQLVRQESFLERLKQEMKSFIGQAQEAEKTLLEIGMERERYVVEKLENTTHLEEIASLMEKHLKLKKEKESQLNEVESVFFSERNKVSALETKAKNQQKILQQNQHLLSGYTEKYTEVKIDLSNMAERLKVEFNVSMEALLGYAVEEEVDIDVLEGKVERLRHRKQNFGEVNPMAVSAYEEMKERHDLIVQQRQDVLDAKVSLEETIREIEGRATERFMEAFVKIRENFIEVFRSLFRSEDSCDLRLEDEENPLESTIHIVAKPKGKKPRSLSQLSGGEKTLTATAVLFALYLMKPAPFCVFDEIDAPLDDVNIDKFNNIIKDFSEHSQFIIVTHNKVTMASVDVLYGVFTDEPGISGVSAVDFRHYEDSGLAVSEG